MSVPDGWRNRHTDAWLSPKDLAKCMDCDRRVSSRSAIRCVRCAHAFKTAKSLAAANAAKERDRAKRIDRTAAAIAEVLGCDVTDAVRRLAGMVAFTGKGETKKPPGLPPGA